MRHIQQSRKEIGLEIQNRIKINYHSTDEDVKTTLQEHGDYICRETLCDELTLNEKITENSTRKINLGGSVLHFSITKAG